MTNRLQPNEKDYYSRNLPHWQPENATLCITTRLSGSLPRAVIKELQEIKEVEEKKLKSKGLSEKEIIEELRTIRDLYFGKFDALLDGTSTGPHWLKDEQNANIWIDSLFHFDGERYHVICSTVMSNHVHFIIYKLNRSLARIMKTMKGFSAREINKVIGRTGNSFWHIESFDRMIRDSDELANQINYILNNPVKIGLVNHWEDWQFNYVHPDFLKYVRTPNSASTDGQG